MNKYATNATTALSSPSSLLEAGLGPSEYKCLELFYFVLWLKMFRTIRSCSMNLFIAIIMQNKSNSSGLIIIAFTHMPCKTISFFVGVTSNFIVLILIIPTVLEAFKFIFVFINIYTIKSISMTICSRIITGRSIIAIMQIQFRKSFFIIEMKIGNQSVLVCNTFCNEIRFWRFRRRIGKL